MPTTLTNQVESNINANRDSYAVEMKNLTAQIAKLEAENIQISEDISYNEDLITRAKSFHSAKSIITHPILSLQASGIAVSCSSRKLALQAKLTANNMKIASLQQKLSLTSLKDSVKAQSNDNGIKNIGGKMVLVKNGVIDFSKSGKHLTANLFDPSTGKVTPNFEKLKQVLVDYPKSLTTLPDNVIKELNNHSTQVRVITSIFMFKGQQYHMTDDKTKNCFHYLTSITSAGFNLAEQQGREVQNDPKAKVQFADWVKEKQDMLANAKKTTPNQNTNQTYAAM